MPLLATPAIVLHAFDYLESSRILRLVTREGGVRSALAKGARRSSRRFGSAVDLFAQGGAQLHAKPGRRFFPPRRNEHAETRLLKQRRCRAQKTISAARIEVQPDRLRRFQRGLKLRV